MAYLGQPTSITSFHSPLPSSSTTTKANVGPQLRIAPVHGSEEPQVVAAVQGAALWFYDLSTSNAVNSFTLSPNTTFCTAPICFHVASSSSSAVASTSSRTRRSKQKERRTVIGLASGDKVSSAEQYRTLSVWKGDETFECVNIALEHPVQELEYIEGSEAFLAASDDAITIVDSDLTPRCLRFSPLKKTTPGGRSTTLRKVLVLRPSRGADEDVLEVVLVYNAGSAIILRVSDFAGPDAKIVNERVVNLAGEATHLAKGEEIVDAFLNGGKAIHLQTSRGRILANGLVIDGSATCTKYGFKTAENATAAVAAISTPTGSLLVACKPAPTGSKLVLFQPNYPSVLAVRDLPASLANAVSTSLVRLTDTVLGLVSCEAAAAGGDGKARAHAWAIDLSLPSQGVGIAQMLESHAKTREYLELEVTQASAAAVVHTPRKGGLKKPSTSTSSTAAAARDQTLLTSLDECLKGRTASAGQEKDAEDAWTRWLAEEKAQKSASAAEHAAGGRSKSKFASSVVEMVLSRALGREPGARPPSTASDAPDASELSNSAPTTTGPRGAYARNIIVSLLEQGWISDRSFAPQGVILGGLLPLGDWTSIDLALRRMRSVDSTTTVALLKRVVQSAESAAAHTQSASGVVSAPPSLARFLRTFVQVPTSPPLHRVALHRAGFTAEESTRILDVLVGWFEEDAQHQEGTLSKGWEEMMGLPASANTSSDAHQGKGRSRGMKGVEIDQVVQHLTLLLDAHLPLLLSHSPAHELLARLQAATTPVIAAQSELALAKGAFDAFSKENESRIAASSRNGKGGKTPSSNGVISEYGAGLWKLEEVRL